MPTDRLILVTGGTGYVARCLIPALLERGYRLRVLAREPDRLLCHSWSSQVELLRVDLLSPPELDRALEGVAAAFYLVHNMSSGRGYVRDELASANNFASAAEAAGLEHIIYLGGLADPHSNIGSHLRSRLRTGETLRHGPVPVTEFRASLIIGSGSISFEMIRYLTEQLPLALGRKWIRNRAQPISIRNVVDYLVASLEQPQSRSKVYEIGGGDVLTYAETMLVYARLRGLHRRIVALPWLPVRVMAGLAGILTPIPASISGPLIDGMRSDSLVTDQLALRDFSSVELLDYETSVRQALAHLTPDGIELNWPVRSSMPGILHLRQEGFFIEASRDVVDLPPELLFQAITGLGGRHGWLYLDGLWHLRGWIDRLLGGPGLRGRKETGILSVGDIVDFYRLEVLEPDKRMRLRAELKAPGQGWMEWRIVPTLEGSSMLEQVAYFAPLGLQGFLYWYLLLPFHRLVFAGLFRALIARANRIAYNLSKT